MASKDITMKRGEFHQVFKHIRDLNLRDAVKFNYSLIKVQKVIQAMLEDIADVLDKMTPPKMKDYREKEVALGTKYEGKPNPSQPGQFIVDKEKQEDYDKELKALQEEYKETLDKNMEMLKEEQKLLNEDETLTFPRLIRESTLPDALLKSDLEILDPFIIEE